jgi:hypothetical protein
MVTERRNNMACQPGSSGGSAKGFFLAAALGYL